MAKRTMCRTCMCATCDASVFLTCTDKTTTISILAFSLRNPEHLIENFRRE
jgi:hypothetical protein